MGDASDEMSASDSDEEMLSISISLPDDEDPNYGYYVEREIQWPTLKPYGTEEVEEEDEIEREVSSIIDSGYEETRNRYLYPFSMSQRYSESSLSSPSTPEPLKGKLCMSEGGQVGLNNLGNTCYLNSTLQCLTAAHELSYKLAQEYEESVVDKTLFLQVTSRLFHEMWVAGGKSSSIRRSVAPNQFKSVLGRIDSRFSGYRQEDSQEALSIILDKLHEDLKSAGDVNVQDDIVDVDGWLAYCRKENSIVRELFHGQLKSSITCQKCLYKSETFDPFSILNLPIPTGTTTSTYTTSDNLRSDRTNNNITTGKFKMFCFNDRILNADTAYLIVRREFKSAYEFRMFYRGSSCWIVELKGNEVVSVRTNLPSPAELLKEAEITFISYPADLLSQNYLVSFVAAETDEIVGFPVLLRTPLNDGNILTPSKFIETFLLRLIRSILQKRFPDRLKFFDAALALMLASANEYFKIEVVKSEYYLTQVKVIILNDKSDFNELIFFREIDDPNDLFEDLCINLCVDEDSLTSESDNNEYIVNVNGNTGTVTNNVTIVDCFDRLLSVEKLIEADNWKCEKCKVAVCAEKKLELWRLPDLMILHLKRFSYGSASGYYGSYLSSSSGGSKISKSIDFPLELDMAELKGSGSPDAADSKYELFAISQHSGSLDYGHYTAIVKHEECGKWLLMDDSHVHVYETEEEWLGLGSRVKELAYVLFYRRIKE